MCDRITYQPSCGTYGAGNIFAGSDPAEAHAIAINPFNGIYDATPIVYNLPVNTVTQQ